MLVLRCDNAQSVTTTVATLRQPNRLKYFLGQLGTESLVPGQRLEQRAVTPHFHYYGDPVLTGVI